MAGKRKLRILQVSNARVFGGNEEHIRTLVKYLDRDRFDVFVAAPQHGEFAPAIEREKIKTFDPYFHQPWVEEAPAVLVACANPHDTWATYDERDDCFVLDTAAAIQNVLLAIHDLGLGAVWILSFSPRAVRKALGVPPHIRILSIVPFGYYELGGKIEFRGGTVSNKAEPLRRPAEELFFLEEYGVPL